MLTSPDSAYVKYLKQVADELTPGRVNFLAPVPTADVIRTISDFDMGFCYIAPTIFSYLVSLPNKFFDFIAAGIPVCIGASPSMAEIVRSYDLGCISRSFEPADLAAALNGLTPERFVEMQEGARRASREINAEREMGKLAEIYGRLLAEEAR
jgi:glycosyltransferase involved in cell wall biosynthesis